MADAFSAGAIPLPRSVLDTNVRQLPSYGGSAETALADVQRYLENKFRVVVFASTTAGRMCSQRCSSETAYRRCALPERRSAAGGTGHRCGGRALRGS